jgi:hypothetical protein
VDRRKRNLQGSRKRDIFKRCHKELEGAFYASDLDLILVAKSPPGIVAILDYKAPGEAVTFTEAIIYNQLLAIAPVYIVEAHDPEAGPFTIRRYLGADWRPDPPRVRWGETVEIANWEEFEEWERLLRQGHKSSKLMVKYLSHCVEV